MIRGIVHQRLEPRIDLSVLDSSGSPLVLSVGIDTGFYGFLALPPATISHLALESISLADVQLADGSIRSKQYYEATILWDGRHRTIRVTELDTEPFIGVNLLWNQHLAIDMVVGGNVAIHPIGETE